MATLQAMHAHPPGPHRKSTIPHLWGRVRAHFAAAFARYAPTSLVRRARFTRPQRDAFDFAVVPLEKMVRALLVSGAVAWLLMTPAGHRLRLRTPRRTPQPPAPSRTSTRIPHPGWNTLARPPRAPAPQRPRLDREVPATWTCPFRVLRSTFGDDAPRQPPPRPRRAVWAQSLACTERDPFNARRAPPRHSPPPPEPCSALARRIETLRRVLANPQPAIRRLARKLAALPKHTLHAADPGVWHRRYHLSPAWDDWLASFPLLTCAIRALDLSG
jgi:hypothetical protein